MTNHEIARYLRTLADKIEVPEPPAANNDEPHNDSGPRAPSDLLALVNNKGYSLQQCLFTLARKVEQGEWSMVGSLERQAKAFGVELSLVHDAIRSLPNLHRRFAAFPEHYPFAHEGSV